MEPVERVWLFPLPGTALSSDLQGKWENLYTHLLTNCSLHIPHMLLQQKFPKQPQTGDIHVVLWIPMQTSVLAGKPVPHLIL